MMTDQSNRSSTCQGILKWGVALFLSACAWNTQPGWFPAVVASLITTQTLLHLGRRELSFFNFGVMGGLANAMGWLFAGLSLLAGDSIPNLWFFAFFSGQVLIVATQDIR